MRTRLRPCCICSVPFSNFKVTFELNFVNIPEKERAGFSGGKALEFHRVVQSIY